MTEYEERFSAAGNPICKYIIRKAVFLTCKAPGGVLCLKYGKNNAMTAKGVFFYGI